MADPPHLRRAAHMAPAAEPKPTSIVPPHLRGFNKPRAKKNFPLTGNAPPTHLQAKPTSANAATPPHLQAKSDVSSAATPPHLRIKTIPAIKIEQKSTQFMVSPPDALHLEREPAVGLFKAPTKTVSDEQAFEEMILKNKEDMEAKRKGGAEKALLTPTTIQAPRIKFRPTEDSDQAMQSFLAKQLSAPAANGKKYIYTGGEKSFPPSDAANATFTSAHQIVSSKSQVSMIRSEKPDAVNIEALVAPGFEPGQSSQGFNDQISDAGVIEMPKENIRATQGEDPQDALRDWNGKMLPAPVDWETDRASFDNSFMKRYVKSEWEPKVPSGPSVAIDTAAKEFQDALPVGFEAPFVAPPEQPTTKPDFDNSEKPQKQRLQTAEGSSALKLKALARKGATSKDKLEAQESQYISIVSRIPEAHPYAPTIEIYLRPATTNDAKGIANVYNSYILASHSIISEDQKGITSEDAAFLITHSRSEKLPIIVAVKGAMPATNTMIQKGKSNLPQFETIVGFGYAETWNYGLGGGGRMGRSRFTSNIQFYVELEYTGKKIGRSLLDRLIQILSHGYGAKDGYDWLNSSDDPVYNQGGVNKFHQIVIQFAVRPTNDPNYQRFKDFLARYYFEEEGRIRHIARSSTKGPDGPFFADIIFFAKEASPESEFSPVS